MKTIHQYAIASLCCQKKCVQHHLQTCSMSMGSHLDATKWGTAHHIISVHTSATSGQKLHSVHLIRCQNFHWIYGCVCVCVCNKTPHQQSATQLLNSKHFITVKIFSSWICFKAAGRETITVFYCKGSFSLLLCRLEEAGWLASPLPPLCVIQNPVIGGGKEKGPQRQWMSQMVRKKELALGTDIGNACQLMSSPLDGRLRGQSGGEALLGWQTGCCKHANNLRVVFYKTLLALLALFMQVITKTEVKRQLLSV